jgi:hypothetical protein
MQREAPLWQRIHDDPCYVEVVRAVGYGGMTYRELTELIEKLALRFSKTRVESATYHLVTFEGQTTCNPNPLAQVSLRANVRTLAWQLLGPPPEHPEADHFKSDQPWVPPWQRAPVPPREDPKKEESPTGKPERSRRKAS